MKKLVMMVLAIMIMFVSVNAQLVTKPVEVKKDAKVTLIKLDTKVKADTGKVVSHNKKVAAKKALKNAKVEVKKDSVKKVEVKK